MGNTCTLCSFDRKDGASKGIESFIMKQSKLFLLHEIEYTQGREAIMKFEHQGKIAESDLIKIANALAQAYPFKLKGDIHPQSVLQNLLSMTSEEVETATPGSIVESYTSEKEYDAQDMVLTVLLLCKGEPEIKIRLLYALLSKVDRKVPNIILKEAVAKIVRISCIHIPNCLTQDVQDELAKRRMETWASESLQRIVVRNIVQDFCQSDVTKAFDSRELAERLEGEFSKCLFSPSHLRGLVSKAGICSELDIAKCGERVSGLDETHATVSSV
eukprot:CAMPEP_0115020282 /NCGR_PEP_ID=MMETSP0216-20121206/29996_1 /TAXON_ID=223996 /ORGANISM="Protocruzia adherens, Strain Boccale" /LENGTH=272 /DNA_ID=CAMNT_0002392013 /DNA_START=50 /DNA_END=868 /DNA_ORIENTATION=+